ncbi:hypothetical protein ACUNH4_25755, partial [Serratia sp. IR-2025]
REGKGREGKGREGKGREGKGREGKGREGKGQNRYKASNDLQKRSKSLLCGSWWFFFDGLNGLTATCESFSQTDTGGFGGV